MEKFLKFMRLLAFFALLAISLPGCLGNGEGYGRPMGDTSEDFGAGQGSGPVTFYWLDPNYRCTLPGSDIPIISYRQSIRVDGQQAFLMGDRCQSVTDEIPYSDLVFSSSLQFLGYEEGIYIYIPGAITNNILMNTRPVEAWCRTSDPSNEYIYDITIRAPVGPFDLRYAQVHVYHRLESMTLFGPSTPETIELHTQLNDTYLPVDRIERMNSRDYEGSNISATISRTVSHYVSEGNFQAFLGETSISQITTCRMLEIP